MARSDRQGQFVSFSQSICNERFLKMCSSVTRQCGHRNVFESSIKSSCTIMGEEMSDGVGYGALASFRCQKKKFVDVSSRDQLVPAQFESKSVCLSSKESSGYQSRSLAATAARVGRAPAVSTSG